MGWVDTSIFNHESYESGESFSWVDIVWVDKSYGSFGSYEYGAFWILDFRVWSFIRLLGCGGLVGDGFFCGFAAEEPEDGGGDGEAEDGGGG